MLKQIMTLVSMSLAGLSMPVYAGSASPSPGAGDVCSIRPDLCDQDAPAMTAKRPAAKKSCRIPGGNYSAAQISSLPLCKSKTAQQLPGEDTFWETKDTAKRSRAPAAVMRAPASAHAAIAPDVSFDDYMASNALNPALSNKIKDHQRAFVDTSKAAVISFPADGTSIHEDSDPASVTSPITTSAAAAPVPAPSAAAGGGSPLR